ncbi:HD domain-containing protein [Streptomyces sp. NPDC056661]|uniref:HD domain-containing protein n=1 Tax=Streptomyces sp. NPDC056661 TaxID=3345898 RepID=UPI0036D073BE
MRHDRDSEGWLPLWPHIGDSAAVAGLPRDRWLAASIRRLIASALPSGEHDVRRLVVWCGWRGCTTSGRRRPRLTVRSTSLQKLRMRRGLEMRSA